jgi:hypothetical protein
MEIYQLLKDFGLEIDIKDFTPVLHKETRGFKPHRMEGPIPVFTSEQINDYGPPELYGFTNYQVIELECTAHPRVADYQFERDRERPRPIHRYNRIERFEFILAQLLGRRGDIPDTVMGMMHYLNKDKDKVWNSARSILKHYKQRKYYNRIPTIFLKLGLGPLFEWDRTQITYDKILCDFKILHNVFEYCQKRKKWNRKYFPSLRFVAVKLLEKYGATCQFKVDFIRTKRKRKALGDLWNDFN